jgi:hypothetical protein
MKDLHFYFENLTRERLEEIASFLKSSNKIMDDLFDEIFRIGRMIWYWETNKKLPNKIKDKRIAEIVSTVATGALLYKYYVDGYLLVNGRFSVLNLEKAKIEFTVRGHIKFSVLGTTELITE